MKTGRLILQRVQHMSRRGQIAAGTAIVLTGFLAGMAAAAPSNISFHTGTVASYDFGGFGPGYAVPGTIQIHAFTLQPGDTIPWHYHKGASYVILKSGTLSETHLVGPHRCAKEELTAGHAFIESPGQVHTVTNNGADVAVIWWSTIFPKSDGIVEFSPEFKAGGISFVTAPNCDD
jgi:quercetin dioxygenase-like cupin family protein